MTSRSQGANAGNTDQTSELLMAPLRAFSLWNPFVTQALSGNDKAHGALGEIAGEWQAFLGRRFNEDVALMQRLTSSRSPDQVLAAYTDFWQKAAQDYGREFSTLTKLMTDATREMLPPTRPTADGAREKPISSRWAA